LRNYIVLNEKAGKWICPVCNKPALFDDLQIDLHTESILDAIQNQNITEITIDGDLRWTPVSSASIEIQNQHYSIIHDNDIVLDDDDDDNNNGDHEKEVDSKSTIQLIASSLQVPTIAASVEPADVILIDDD